MGPAARRPDLWPAHDHRSPGPANRSLYHRPASRWVVPSTCHEAHVSPGYHCEEQAMSLTVQRHTEPDGTLKYLLPAQDVIVRVLAQRRNGTKKCPVELLHQADLVVATDCNLRDLRDL